MAMTMAKPSLQTAAILLLLVAAASCLHTVDADAAALGFCWGKCSVRCGRASAPARGACMSSCGLCCEECNCVPARPPRDINDCPCYRNMLTAGPRKRPKCP